MKTFVLSAMAVAALAGSAFAQNGTVEYRIRELNGQTAVDATQPAPNSDNVLDFVVEARVTGAANRGLGDWGFNVRIQGEPEANGALARLRTSQADGTYFTGAPTTSITGAGLAGIAAQYRFLVGLNAAFNGVINTNSGAFTNGPDQEIGLVTGSARGAALGNTGIIVDPLGDGNFVPATGADFNTALNTWFGANDNFVQLYRFRYTVSNLTARTLQFRLENVLGLTFNSLVQAGSDWSAATTGGTATTSGGTLDVRVGIIPAPATAALLGLGGLVAARRRRA